GGASRARPARLPAAVLTDPVTMTTEALDALVLSVRVAVVATLLNATLGIPLAYLLARRAFRGRAIVDLAVTLPLVLPPTVTGYYLIVLLGRRGWLGQPLYAATGWSVAFTWYAAVIAATVPLAIYTAVQTGEMGEALVLVLALTALSCAVLVLAGRLGARAA